MYSVLHVNKIELYKVKNDLQKCEQLFSVLVCTYRQMRTSLHFWNTEEITDVNHFELKVFSIDYYSRDSNNNKKKNSVHKLIGFVLSLLILFTRFYCFCWKRIASYVVYGSYERTVYASLRPRQLFKVFSSNDYCIRDEYKGRIYTYLSLRRMGAYASLTGISGNWNSIAVQQSKKQRFFFTLINIFAANRRRFYSCPRKIEIPFLEACAFNSSERK